MFGNQSNLMRSRLLEPNFYRRQGRILDYWKTIIPATIVSKEHAVELGPMDALKLNIEAKLLTHY